MKYILSLIFYIVSTLYTILLGIIALPTLFLPNKKAAVFVQKLWADGLLLMLKVFCGIKTEVIGLENIPAEPVIFASKHQSAFETLFFVSLFNNPAYILKKELLFLPVIGFYMKKIGMIAIDRSGGSKTLKDMLQKCRQKLEEKCSIIIFPEGTRSEPHIKAKKYHSGIAAIYKEFSDIPVVPIALNSGVLWGRRSFAKDAGTVTIKFLPPMENNLPRAEFMKKLYNTIETESEKLYLQTKSK